MNATHCPTCKRRYTQSDKTKAYMKALRAGKATKIAKRRLTAGEIRAQVRERAGGLCEACRTRWGFWGWSMDHFLGGSGRKQQKASVETCWALCGTGTTGCHGKRTRNEPSAAFWNEQFKLHCARKHLPIPTLHVEHAPPPRRGTA